MIAALRGKVFQKLENKIFFDVNNVIYEIYLSKFTIDNIKDNDILFIKEIIKEDEYSLYGFKDIIEKDIFEKLLKINGVGAKVALAILSYFTIEEFINIVTDKDINKLTKVNGIGKKVANRILSEIDLDIKISNSYKQEALEALLNLGFSKEDIVKVLNSLENKETDLLIKEALKILSKGF